MSPGDEAGRRAKPLPKGVETNMSQSDYCKYGKYQELKYTNGMFNRHSLAISF